MIDDGTAISVNGKPQKIATGKGISSVTVQNLGKKTDNGVRTGAAIRIGSRRVTPDTGIRLPHRAILVLSDSDVPDELYAISENGSGSEVVVVKT